jgi:hypothetical protein
MGPREKDAIRQTSALMVSMSAQLVKLQKDIDLVRKDLKAVKKVLIRKYKKDGTS